MHEMRMFLLLTASPILMLSVHMVLARIARGGSQQVAALKAILLGSLPGGAILWSFVFSRLSAGPGLAAAVVYSVVVYGLLGVTYFHFFNMSETARRVRILYEIRKAGSLSPGDLTALYKTSTIVTTRLERLVAMKQLKYNTGSYTIDRRTLLYAGRVVLFFRTLLRLDRDEIR